MKMPRLMPLVAIAAGGVLAINAVENGPGIVGAARSFAEGVSARHGEAKAAAAVAADASATAPAGASQVVAAKPAPICAESPTQLAKDAGLSPAELQVIQSLGARRGELDEREQGLDTQLALIQAAEVKVDARIATMTALKADMQALVGQVDDKQQAEVDRQAVRRRRPLHAAHRSGAPADRGEDEGAAALANACQDDAARGQAPDRVARRPLCRPGQRRARRSQPAGRRDPAHDSGDAATRRGDHDAEHRGRNNEAG